MPPRRLDVLDAAALARLESEGAVLLRRLLTPSECEALAARCTRWHRSVDMAGRGFGIGTYHYLREPLPEPARSLRRELYKRLVPLANAVRTREREGTTYPASLTAFWRACRAQGQTRPSSIRLEYEQGGLNHPHRDVYGPVWFPFQALLLLSRQEHDFTGGHFLLLDDTDERGGRRLEVPADLGDLVVFASQARWKQGRRIPVRHGMSLVERGRRHALGLVFHLAQ